MRSQDNAAANSARRLEELLRRVAKQQPEALKELQRQLAPRLLSLIRQIVSNPKVAQEILNRVFVHFRREARLILEAGSSPEAWLALEARALAADWVQTGKRPSRDARARLKSLTGDYSWLPAARATLALEERRPLIAKVLRQLPPSQLRLLDLAVRGGLTEREIAEKLGEPEGKIQSELRAAFAFLRHRLRAVMGAWTIGI